jgi:hypothetical protein
LMVSKLTFSFYFLYVIKDLGPRQRCWFEKCGYKARRLSLKRMAALSEVGIWGEERLTSLDQVWSSLLPP